MDTSKVNWNRVTERVVHGLDRVEWQVIYSEPFDGEIAQMQRNRLAKVAREAAEESQT